MHGLAGGKVIQRPALTAAQINQRGGLQGKGIAVSTITARAVIKQGVHRLQAFERLAQRPGREATAIAQPAGGIDQHQLQVPRQAVMLQAIIGKYQVQRLG
ncbi:hypothetical protein D3C80_1128230 [compost metagenome]